ncbi:hypothetical protein WA026_010931 [Henosepilachna vigintioctopunctata]|uniref:Trehalase n=1 Tax=Henosepilachna vigintioctopunctata TaxID=420089 RepID=A0AAW1V0S0_9CUCU
MFMLIQIIFMFYFSKSSSTTDIPTCSSPLYCQGHILHLLQKGQPFSDSKHYVDMTMKFEERIIVDKFNELHRLFNGHVGTKDAKKFIIENFAMEDELDEWKAPDYSPEPPFLKRILEPNYEVFARKLIPIWNNLGRKVKPQVAHSSNISRHSIIPVPNPFIIPGGRFREFYYWDSYWIAVGLLYSGMGNTVRGMLDNFSWLVKTYGFIPNGGRIYYLNRSQPPVFTMMVLDYLKKNVDADNEWLKKNIGFIEMELNFWLKRKTVTFKMNNVEYTLARYIVNSTDPRPESYYEDFVTCEYPPKAEAKSKCFRELKAGAESGWDFSSRWMTTSESLFDINTSHIAPVDLNAFLVRSFYILAMLFNKIGNKDKSDHWFNIYKKWSTTLHKVMYNEQDGIWYDYDVVKSRQNKQFFCSNFAPLWAQIYSKSKLRDRLGFRAVNYLLKHNVMVYKGGIPATFKHSGEQWDYPNAWPNLQSIVILGLKRSKNQKAEKIAKLLAERWINTNLALFNKTNQMYEKYNAESTGEAGGGGDYSTPTGFGWSNGVVLELIAEFFAKKDNTFELDIEGEFEKSSSSCCESTIRILYLIVISTRLIL